MIRKTRHVVGLACATTLFAIAAYAADAPAEDPAVTAAKNRQAIAEADAAAAKARLGELTATRPTGAVTAENLNIEGKIRAYRAAETAADMIMARISVVNPVPKKVVLFSVKEVADISAYQAFLTQADLLKKSAPALTLPNLFVDQPAPGPCVAPAGPAAAAVPLLLPIDAALQLLSLFKTDQSLKGADVTLDDFGISALLAQRLIAANIPVAYPPSYFPTAFTPPVPGRLDETLDTFNQDRRKMNEFLSKIADKKQEVARRIAAEKNAACKDLLNGDTAKLDRQEASVKAAIAARDAVFETLLKADAQSGLTLLQSLARAELLAKNYSGAHILQLKPVAAGGATITRTNIFGSKIFFSGGVVLSFMLLNATGDVVAAGTVPMYGGIVRDEEMK